VTTRGRYRTERSTYALPMSNIYGSAAADWSRWPAGTMFRLLSTGQIYKIDDYGWALAGRNTIDLYMASRSDMNNWGVRHEPIQVLHWGDPEQSLALLGARQSYKHCRRMALELQGLHDQAAALH
jgi:3D (Asp-Asp-Asp) domain-containing protein